VKHNPDLQATGHLLCDVVAYFRRNNAHRFT
jgi:hypothetical protein